MIVVLMFSLYSRKEGQVLPIVETQGPFEANFNLGGNPAGDEILLKVVPSTLVQQ